MKTEMLTSLERRFDDIEKSSYYLLPHVWTLGLKITFSPLKLNGWLENVSLTILWTQMK